MQSPIWLPTPICGLYVHLKLNMSFWNERDTPSTQTFFKRGVHWSPCSDFCRIIVCICALVEKQTNISWCLLVTSPPSQRPIPNTFLLSYWNNYITISLPRRLSVMPGTIGKTIVSKILPLFQSEFNPPPPLPPHLQYWTFFTLRQSETIQW